MLSGRSGVDWSAEVWDDIFAALAKPRIQSVEDLRSLRMEGRRADILQLADSSEDAVLHAIHRWFLADQIYSSLGPVLVAVNPCRQLASLYSESTLRAHLEGASSSASAPHIYALAARVYRGVLDGRSHSVVISGESGAGLLAARSDAQ